jgi:hypothetical protein
MSMELLPAWTSLADIPADVNIINMEREQAARTSGSISMLSDG